MKRPSSYLRRDNAASTDSMMTPMIDVVFQLLIFFVWTSSFQIIEQILPSQMSAQTGSDSIPVDTPPPEADFDQIVIRIGWDGATPQWKINDSPVGSVDEIRAHLDNLFRIKADATIILHPDPQVPLGPVINAYDQAKLAGFVQVSFAVNPRKKSLP